MGVKIKGKVLLSETVMRRCKSCQVTYGQDATFCIKCGEKLLEEKTKVYANYGKNGISSVSYVFPDGLTFNSKGRVSKKISKGISYTKNIKKKSDNSDDSGKPNTTEKSE